MQPDTDKGMEITRLGRRRKGARRNPWTPRNVLLALAMASCLFVFVWYIFMAGPAPSGPVPEAGRRLL